MKESHRQEKLKDLRDYRAVLIQKQEDLEKKVKTVEQQIGVLRKAG